MADDIATQDGDLEDVSSTLKLVAPVVAIGATFVVRKVLEVGYTRATGSAPPRANDRDQSMGRVLLWAVATAAAIAMVNLAVDRMTAPHRAS